MSEELEITYSQIERVTVKSWPERIRVSADVIAHGDPVRIRPYFNGNARFLVNFVFDNGHATYWAMSFDNDSRTFLCERGSHVIY